MTGKLYKYLNLAKKLMSKSTSWLSISSKSVSCTSPSSPQWFASKCPITESSSGAMSQRGRGGYPSHGGSIPCSTTGAPWYARPHSLRPHPKVLHSHPACLSTCAIRGALRPHLSSSCMCMILSNLLHQLARGKWKTLKCGNRSTETEIRK